jgi:hypothetical protein
MSNMRLGVNHEQERRDTFIGLPIGKPVNYLVPSLLL